MSEIVIADSSCLIALARTGQMEILRRMFGRIAIPKQRQHFEFSGNGSSGILWDELDEDISVQGLLMGVGDRTRGNRLAA